MPHAPVLRGRTVPIDHLTAREIESWSNLARYALESNAYLTPEFVIPASRFLVRGDGLLVTLAETSEHELKGVGIVQTNGPKVSFPFSSAQDLRTPHSFLGGMLLHPEEAVATAETIFHATLRRPWIRALHLRDVPSDGPQWDAVCEAGSNLGLRWIETNQYARATLRPPSHDHRAWEQWVSKGRRKTVRRGRKRISELGTLQWRLSTDGSSDEVERFLSMEHASWKGAAGTSLRAEPSHEAFFKAVIAAFSSNQQVFFTELTLDDTVIASTCNLVTGSDGFAFKVAFDESYRRFSPGVLNEVEFLERNPLSDSLDHIDSGAAAGTYIETLWPDRRLLSSGSWVAPGMAALWSQSAHALRTVKRKVTARKK